MKKVLISYLGRNNSGPVFSIEVAKAFAKNGYEVYAMISSNSQNKDEWLNEPLFKDVLTIDTYTNMKEFIFSSMNMYFFERKKIKEYYKDIEFDYIVRPFYHLWTTMIDKMIKKSQVITFCHDPIMHSGVNKLRRKIYSDFVKDSDKVVVLTEKFIDIVHDKYGIAKENIKYMPHGLMKVYKEKQIKLEKPFYDKNKINFMFFGRIEKYKGIGVLIDAYKLLLEKRKDISLTIVGNGDFSPYEKQCENVENLTVVNKYIPDEEVGIYFDGENVVTVLPYLDATQSGVVPIALEYGVPVISSDTGGLKEQLMNGQIGLFAKPNDEKDLADKMMYFADNLEERQ